MSPARPCDNCAGGLPDEARFCPSCGTPVGTDAGSTERRVVTVVFADLAGFTTLADGRDPETVKVLLDECFGALVPVVEAHGGTVDKIIGDELMAVFGTPIAHEDDPARAVHAALALLETLEAVRPELVMRIGVNTGEVLVGRVGPSGSRTVTGDTVNTAHRLVGVAGPNEVLVGERTHLATNDTISFETRDPYELRGKKDPVPAYVAVGRRRTSGRPPELGFATRIVGRDEQLAVLIDAADTSASSHGVRFVQVLADGGLGKTRLCAEMHRRVVRRRPTRVLWGRGRPYGIVDPWQPLGEALRPVFGVDHFHDESTLRRRLAERVTELVSPGREPNAVGLTRLAELLGLTEPPAQPSAPTPTRGRRHDEQAAVCRAVLEALARNLPLILVIDDAHAVDPLLLDFLAGLEGFATLPLLIVLASREDLSDRPELADIDLARIDLEPLDAESSVELIHVVLQSIHEHDLDEVVLGPTVEARIVEAVGGVPFLIEQVVQYLIDRQLLVSAERRWEVAADFASVGLPDTARAMIDARVDGLDSDQRNFLHNASVFGRVFWADAAASLAEIASVADTDRIVADLTERGLLGDHVDELAGDTTFRHAMVRDAVYSSLPIAERAEKHQRVADFLAELSGETSSAPLDQLAHHSERAVALSLELGEPVDTQRAQIAYERVIAAADDARLRDADQEAERWYRRAAAVAPGSIADRVRSVLAHAEVLIDLRRFSRAAELIDELLDHAAELDLVDLATAHTHAGVCRRLLGNVDGATDCFDEARTLWQQDGDSAGEAFTLSRAGWAELVAGRPRAAQPKLLHAHALETRSSTSDPATLRSLGWCEFLLGDNAEAREHLWQAASGFNTVNDPAGVGWCFGILGFSLWLEGRIGQAHEIASTLLGTAVNSDPWAEGMVLTLMAATAVEQGDVDAAADPIRRAQRLFSEIDDPWGAATAAVVAGMSARIQGRHREARSVLEAGIELTRSSTSVGEEARLLAELASLELDAGDGARAVELARSALELIRSGSGDRDSELRSLVALGRERRRAADLEGALRYFEEAIDLGRGNIPTSAWRRAASHLAMVHAGLGDAEASRVAADLALDGSSESVRTWALAMRGDAAARAAAGDHDGAVRSLRRVLTRLNDRPLAFLGYVRRDLTSLAGGAGGDL